jgi:UDP-2,4-diacetamido-2,4,6-trideoxy-beta-L-altropyranose hydrolase
VQALATGDAWDWLIVDHYGISQEWEERLGASARRLMVIDDLGNRPHRCDLLLDANPVSGNEGKYAPFVPPECRMLLGPRYALLRSAFREMRLKRRDRNGEVARILVFFGGCDEDNYTARALEAVARLDLESTEIDVIVGATNVNVDNIRSLCEKLDQCSLTVQTADMPGHMNNADLAIGAGGTSTWERCCLGLPSVALAIADNQVEVLEKAAETGAVYYVEEPDAGQGGLETHLRALLANRPLLSHMSQRGKELVDGLGTPRVAGALHAGKVILRQATMEDCPSVYEWRNAPETREYAVDTREIEYEDHVAWFEQALGAADRVVLIGEDEGETIGVVRLDLGTEGAELSYYVRPGFKGEGYGYALAQSAEDWLRKEGKDVGVLKALVKAENYRSVKVMEGLGYRRQSSIYVKELITAGERRPRRRSTNPANRH